MPKYQTNAEANSLDAIYRMRDKALQRVVAAYEASDSEAGRDVLDKAIDALTVMHIAATLEWASGSLNSAIAGATIAQARRKMRCDAKK